MGIFDGLFGMNRNNPISVNYDDWLGYTPIGSSSTDTFDFSPERTNTIKTNLQNDGFNIDGFNDSGLFGKNGMLPTIFQGLSAAGGLLQAYSAFKGLGLMKDQLNNAKNAFRTQWQNNVESLGLAAENAGKTNYAMHHGTDTNFDETAQANAGSAAKTKATSGYKNYV